MILSQFEEAVWHRRGSEWDVAEAWHHGGEIVSAVEAVLEFGEVAGYMLAADGAVSASDGALDVAEGGVDPLEGRVQGGLATGSSDDRLVIGMGGHLAVPPLPHHRAYGSVPRRFDRVKLGQRHGVGGDRVSRNSGCAGLVGPPGVRTCARARSVNRRRPLHLNLGTPRTKSKIAVGVF